MFDVSRFNTMSSNFRRVWNYFQSIGDSEETYTELCNLRNYKRNSSMEGVLREVGFIKLPDIVDVTPIKNLTNYEDLGLITKSGRCLLEGRFVFSVKDMKGNILAMIGWYPDIKKYITTASLYFNRSSLFFGLEQLSDKEYSKRVLENQGIVFVCEGIFDALSIRSLGIHAFATMGVELSKDKKLLYPILAPKIVGVSDRDNSGLAVRQNDKWSCWKYFTWTGDENIANLVDDIFEEDAEAEDVTDFKIKDIDDLCKIYDLDDEFRKELIPSLIEDTSKIYKLEL